MRNLDALICLWKNSMHDEFSSGDFLLRIVSIFLWMALHRESGGFDSSVTVCSSNRRDRRDTYMVKRRGDCTR